MGDFERLIFVPGEPVAQGSMKIVPGGAGGRGRLVPSGKGKKVEKWRAEIAKAAVDAHWHLHPVLNEPVRVVLNFVMPRPLYHFTTKGLRPNAPNRHAKKPDLDKLCRAVLDALTQGGVWRDDSQVCSLEAYKTYGNEPGVWIRVIGENA